MTSIDSDLTSKLDCCPGPSDSEDRAGSGLQRRDLLGKLLGLDLLELGREPLDVLRLQLLQVLHLLHAELVQIAPPAELLGEQGCWSVEVRGLEEERLKELEAWLRSVGAEASSIRATGRELSQLYRPRSTDAQ